MAEAAVVDAQPRTALGKKVKALRRTGITPIHVYGHGGESLSLQANTYDLVRTILDAGYTTPLTVKVGRDEHFVMIKEVQRHPVSEFLLHVDLIRISRTERLQASIPLQVEGEAPGAREEGAQLSQDLYAVDVEALPMDLPNSITVDLSLLSEVGASITAGQLELPPNVTLVTDPEATVARIVHHAVEVEEEEEAAEEAEAEGEEAAAEEGAAEPAAQEEGEKEEG